MKPKSYVKRKWKLGSVHIHRNVIDKKGKMRTLIGTFAHIHELVHVIASGKIIKNTKFVLHILFSFHPNLDAFSLCTHGLAPHSQGSDNHWSLQYQ